MLIYNFLRPATYFANSHHLYVDNLQVYKRKLQNKNYLKYFLI